MSERATTIPAAAPDPGRVDDDKVRVLLVTGMSGAGKTSALKALEDMDYEAVDNVPLVLLSSLVLPGQRDFRERGFRRPLAIGIDIRTRDFGVEPFRQEIDRLRDESEVEVQVLFLDCDDDELRRRYAETRHRHPLAADRPVADGIARERQLMEGLRDRADMVLDTTGLGPGTSSASCAAPTPPIRNRAWPSSSPRSRTASACRATPIWCSTSASSPIPTTTPSSGR